MSKRPILVWRFEDAPAEYRALSKHGGDEDWVALVPAVYADAWIGWMVEGTPFGCCEVSVHPLGNGDTVRIGAHA